MQSMTKRRSRRSSPTGYIEVFEDEQYYWWWALYETRDRTEHEQMRSGPYADKEAALRNAHGMHPDIHLEVIPWHLP